MKHLALSLVLVAGYLFAVPAFAAASCVGPTITHDTGKFAAGDQLDIEGFAFGDNCYDTGDPPAGEGVLGKPLTDIEINLVQGDLVIPVAAGDADSAYEFMVSVTIPSDLEPGEFVVVATIPRFGEAWNQTQDIVSLISSEVISPAVVAEFTPSDAPMPQPAAPQTGEREPVSASGDDTGFDAAMLALIGFAIFIALTAAGVVAWRANKQ